MLIKKKIKLKNNFKKRIKIRNKGNKNEKNEIKVFFLNYKLRKSKKKFKQAGTELCQAQHKLELAKYY